ncbi:kinase-like protein [Clavulina sp. PMI_390]|nr:kinase-like protein [Clavulina sp. PMI_390]
MVLQHAKYSSAREYLQSQHGLGRFLGVVRDVVNGLAYLHSRSPPVIHGDLHDKNILITASGDALICDFGLSRIRHDITRTNTSLSQGGRLRFLSPELSRGPDQFRTNEASDIYSLAMTIYSLGVGKVPLWEIERDIQAVKLLEEGRRPGPESNARSSETMESLGDLDAVSTLKLWSLLGQMWVHEPEERITIAVVSRALLPMLPSKYMETETRAIPQLVVGSYQLAPASIELAGVSFPVGAVPELLTRARAELPLRVLRIPILGEYDETFTGAEFVT